MTGKNRDEHYEDLLLAFGEDAIKERFAFLLAAARTYLKDKKIEDLVSINVPALSQAVIDYFADINRLKDFHLIEKANRAKVAAYTAYWVCRRKPLSIIGQGELLGKFSFLQDLNEWFTIYLIFSMNYDCTKPLHGENVLWNKLNVFIKNLQYFLVYRVVTPQAIELSLVALEATPVHEPLY